MDLSKNKIKMIRALEMKKHRRETGLFVAEGNKLVTDNLAGMKCETLIATPEWFAANPKAVAPEMITATREEIGKASFLKTPQEVMGIFRQPEYDLHPSELKQKLTLVLDTVQDPGNLGTIIRLADWFGIENIVCSPETADCFAPKTVQATMGAIARIRVHYTPLVPFLEQMTEVPVYGTFLEGENIYSKSLSQNGLVIMGNEGKGISDALRPFITDEVHIPSFPSDRETSESLNVAIATAIICSEFRRNPGI
ncbi:MAG: RNA methyltransferase [Bacteroidales bacterium]